MQVHVTKNLRFTHPKNTTVHVEVPAGQIRDVPDWVRQSTMFAAAVAEGSARELGTAVPEAPAPKSRKSHAPKPGAEGTAKEPDKDGEE